MAKKKPVWTSEAQDMALEAAKGHASPPRAMAVLVLHEDGSFGVSTNLDPVTLHALFSSASLRVETMMLENRLLAIRGTPGLPRAPDGAPGAGEPQSPPGAPPAGEETPPLDEED